MKLSIMMITYNHEKFIAQALESILMQKVDFEYEIVIGEDCSKDSTRRILRDYQQRYPERIRLRLPDVNQGMHQNFFQTLAACRGDYIALLEGDDYWTSADKLQKQADFLDSHSDCALCFHPVTMFQEEGGQEPFVFPAQYPEVSELEDLLEENFIPNCAVMFRSGLIQEYPSWLYTLKLIDWPLHILHAQHGKIGCIRETMGAYRMHRGGVWSGQGKVTQVQEFLKMYDHLKTTLDSSVMEIVQSAELKYLYDMAWLCALQGEMEKARYYANLCLKEREHNRYISAIKLMRLFLRLYVPGVNYLARIRHSQVPA